MIRQTTERDVVTIKTLSTLKFKKVGGIWVNTLRTEGQEEADEEEDLDQDYGKLLRMLTRKSVEIHE